MNDTPGTRLRRLREARGLGVRELAERSAYSPSAISRYEHGSRAISVAAGRRLAAALDVSPAELLGLEAPSPRVAQETTVLRNGGRATRLSRLGPGGHMRIVRLELPARERLGPLGAHAGYEWLFVLRGEVELQVDERVERLVEGEAAEFDTGRPHAMRAAGGAPATVLIVLDESGVAAHRL